MNYNLHVKKSTKKIQIFEHMNTYEEVIFFVEDLGYRRKRKKVLYE